jgi:hypothetical protein
MVFGHLNDNGPMQASRTSAVLMLIGGFWANCAFSQELGDWSFGQTTDKDGKITYFASIHANNMISSGGGEANYAPLYSIGCHSGDAAHWVQRLELEDGVSRRGDIELNAIIDDKAPREENWQIGSRGRILTRENTPDIAELRRAASLELSWNWGWSWMWISDEAKINLGEIGSVIFTLAKSCGIEEPN